MKATRPAEPESSRLRILKAAEEVAAERGYEGATISRICERSGLPVSSLYWFFTDKDELLGEVVKHSFNEWISAQPTWSSPSRDGNLGERVRAVLSRSVRSLPNAPEFLRIGHMLVLERRETEPAARRLFLEVRREVQSNIEDWFRSSLEVELTARHPELPTRLATLVIACTDGLFLAHQITDAQADEFVDMIVTVIETAVESTRRLG